MVRFAAIRQLLQEYGSDRIGTLSAAFAYVAIFSIGSLLLILISLAGFFFGLQAAEGKLYAELSGTLGPEAAKTIQQVVAHTYRSRDNLLALTVGIIGIILGAAGIANQLQGSFNKIFSVVPDPKAGIKRTVYAQLKNILLVVAGTLSITLLIVATTVVTALGNAAWVHFGTKGPWLEISNALVSWVLFTLIVYALYRTLPDLVIPRRVALVAALSISTLFLAGKYVLGIIIGKNTAVSAYGAAASFVTLLLWAYYSGQLLYIGAEGIKVYAVRRGYTYDTKRFNVRRTSLNIDSNSISNRLIKTWRERVKKIK
jgi:membrane protein